MSPVNSWADKVPLIGAPWADVTVAVSFGNQVWVDDPAVVSLTTKHSPDDASLEPV